jgi:two-component system, sensor histidine kinase
MSGAGRRRLEALMAASNSNNAWHGGQDCLCNTNLPSILIVDDSHDSANTLGSLFSAHGYKIYVAYDGEAALEAANTHLPDVILLDLGMPGPDGVHLARFFREDEQLKDKVLIAITGYADEMHRSQCDSAGIDYVFPKPAAWEDLKSTIDRLCSKRTMS